MTKAYCLVVPVCRKSDQISILVRRHLCNGAIVSSIQIPGIEYIEQSKQISFVKLCSILR